MFQTTDVGDDIHIIGMELPFIYKSLG